MKKVLLLSCFISFMAHAGTGGGISTPPGRAGLAKLLAETIGLDSSMFLMKGTGVLPLEIIIETEAGTTPAVDPVTTVDVANASGERKSFNVTDGEVINQYVLKDRRQMLRASMLRQP